MDPATRQRRFEKFERTADLPMMVLALLILPLLIIPLTVDLPHAPQVGKPSASRQRPRGRTGERLG